MEEFISKKELLEITNISYGQLYRWKRKQIIPEEWFLKRAVSSGQETFFPKEQILERIHLILNRKEARSLDDLAKMVSIDFENEQINLQKLMEMDLVQEEDIQLYKKVSGKEILEEMYDFVAIKLFKEQVMTHKMTIDEARLLDEFMRKYYQEFMGETARIYLLRQSGIPFILGTKDYKTIVLDESYQTRFIINLYKEVSTIKLQISKEKVE